MKLWLIVLALSPACQTVPDANTGPEAQERYVLQQMRYPVLSFPGLLSSVLRAPDRNGAMYLVAAEKQPGFLANAAWRGIAVESNCFNVSASSLPLAGFNNLVNP